MEKEHYQPSAEEMAKAQEMADVIQNERGEEMMTEKEKRQSDYRMEEKPRQIMTENQRMASKDRCLAVETERSLRERGLGKLTNIKLKEYVSNDDGGATVSFEGEVDGHRIIVNTEGPYNDDGAMINIDAVTIDGLPLPLSYENRELFKDGDILNFLRFQVWEYKSANRVKKDLKERKQNEQTRKANEWLKSILSKEKQEEPEKKEEDFE